MVSIAHLTLDDPGVKGVLGTGKGKEGEKNKVDNYEYQDSYDDGR